MMNENKDSAQKTGRVTQVRHHRAAELGVMLGSSGGMHGCMGTIGAVGGNLCMSRFDSHSGRDSEVLRHRLVLLGPRR